MEPALDTAINRLDGSMSNPRQNRAMYANGFRQQEMQNNVPRISEQDLPPIVNQAVEYADRDRTAYIGNPTNVKNPTFMQAVSGIENGDFEGLEMLNFGALADGTPAAAFVDEDGQRQVIKLTVPQWMAAIEHRSQGRQQLEQQRILDAKRRQFQPYFNNMAKKVSAANDPDIGGYLAAMYQNDPEMAVKQLGEFMRQQQKQDAEMITWRGKPVTKEFAQQALNMESAEYKQGNEMYRQSMSAYADQPYAAPLIENMVALRRKPEQYSLPSTMTLIDNLNQQNAGPLPVVSLLHAMTKPMMTPLPEPITLPHRDADGQYNMVEMTNLLNSFNSVSQRLGWSPILATDEVGLSALVDALDVANNAKRAISNVAAPPARTVPVAIQRQQMANEAYAQRETLKYGGAMPQQDQGGGQQQGGVSEQDANAILSETVAMLKVNPTEDPKAVLQRIVSLGNDPARLKAANQYSDEQKQMIMQAAQVIRQYQNK